MKNYIQKVAWALVLLLAATLSLSAKDGTAVRKLFKKGVSDSISVGGSKLVVLQKDLIRNRSLSVNSIGEENVPELDFAMTNVTAGGQGYRFLPHGTHFTGEGATVKIKYDRTRIPSGYTEDDIRTYYYDPAEKHWVALERVRVDKKEECVVSKTTHFTDMINGVIQAPESPQTEGFAPTMMNDIKAADPTAKINVIAPPSANNRGSANLQYPFEMPPARNGMQLVLGRGGDQAVVKRGANYAFYGGKRQVTTKNSRVKARLFAEALHQLMDTADAVFIMGHSLPDMDCVGAGLGIMRCAKSISCPAYFVLDESNASIDGAIEAMKENKAYRDTIKTPEQAAQMMRSSSLLIIVDTQRKSSLLSAELLEKAGKAVVIDHHRRAVDSIQNPTLNYLEAGSSSACEMVTEVIQYFDDGLKPTTFECGALLAGITMDTKHFSFNTGARTFEAASYLRRNGADNTTVKMMFQDDMQTYRNRAKVVENAIIMEQGIAISACPAGMEATNLIAAQAADELVNIKGIQASFVLAERGQVLSLIHI